MIDTLIPYPEPPCLAAPKTGGKATRRSIVLWSIFLVLGVFCQALNAQELLPAAYWSFNRCGLDVNEDNERIILDGSGNGNHLVLEGVTCARGKFGRAGSFDGVEGLAETEENVLNFTEKLTISAWVYPETVDGVQTIVNKWYGMDSYALSIAKGAFEFKVTFPGGPWGITVTVSAPATAGKWSHVVGVFDGESQKARIYVNGVREGSTKTPGNILQQSMRPVAVGNHPTWNPFNGLIDEVGLYNAALSGRQVRNLGGKSRRLYLGADTNVHPELDQFPNGEENGYDFYVGRLGWSVNKCRIQYPPGFDLITGEPLSPDDTCQFQLEAAAIARPERTCAYWWVAGPAHADAAGKSPFDFGKEQAKLLIQQWRTYKHIVYGRTLFADIEGAGWDDCRNGGLCDRNRQVLEGFLQTIAAKGFRSGVYTNPETWLNVFGREYTPSTPFVLWLTSCDTYCGRSVDRAALNTVKNTVLGGMKTVIWQYHIDCPDYDATSMNPCTGFFPNLEVDDVSYRCTCDELGGHCPPEEPPDE
jgi:hypothetical protein